MNAKTKAKTDTLELRRQLLYQAAVLQQQTLARQMQAFEQGTAVRVVSVAADFFKGVSMRSGPAGRGRLAQMAVWLVKMQLRRWLLRAKF